MNQNKIQVMLCDDSGTIRKLVKRAIEADMRIQVVAQAQNGRDAVEQLKQVKPDILVLDVAMPVMDGIDTVKAIRRSGNQLPIVMFSSFTTHDAEATIDAMQAGATDFVHKPSSQGHVSTALKDVQLNLIPKLMELTKSFAESAKLKSKRTPTLKRTPAPAENSKPNTDLNTDPKSDSKPDLNRNPTSASARTSSPAKVPVPAEAAKAQPLNASFDLAASRKNRINVVGIGSSTGGPAALTKLLTNIPSKFPFPILIAQHMPPQFTAMLAQRLSEQTGHQVEEAKDGQVLKPSQILIAPGGYHMVIRRRRAEVIACLNQDAQENDCRPAIDPLFRSIAECYGSHSVGVVMTGMGKDGTEGAKMMKAKGAEILVQDEQSCVVWGMPNKVLEAGVADAMMSPEELGKAIASLCKSNETKSLTAVK